MQNLIVFGAILTGIQAMSQTVPFFDVVEEQLWTSYKLTHRKQYGSDMEEKLRLKIYRGNMHKIAVHNQKYELGLVSYKLSSNKYADMLHHELIQTLNGFNRTKRLLGANMIEDKCGYDGLTYMAPSNVVLPDFVDWRMKGAVTAVKNQGLCASCWSFSATGSLEGQHFRKSKKLVSLSEQNLIDCSAKYGNNGCFGGLIDYAFKYIKDNHGLDTEKSYPYEAGDDTCRYNPENSGATGRGFTNIESGNEDDLKSAVATVGPISVAIDGSHESFHFYSEGVYDEPNCDSQNLDHAVLVVGYGTTDHGVDYWIVKNSWGTSWGDKGYILMSRNKDNQCGIASSASYPVV